MSKKAISFVLAIILIVSIATAASVCAFAEDDSVSDDISLNISTDTTAPSTAEPTTVSANGKFPNLTVNAISNYFPRAAAEYNSTTKEVTVIYWLNLSKNILNTQWYITYDSSVFSVSERKNTPASVCPTIGANGSLDFSKDDTITFNASSLRLFDFSSQMVPYAKIVFDVKDLNFESAVTTTVDLTVDTLQVSKVDSETQVSVNDEETLLVNDSMLLHNQDTMYIEAEYKTTLTVSNYVAPTVPETTVSTDDEVNAEQTTTEQPTSVGVTDPDINSSDNPITTEAPTTAVPNVINGQTNSVVNTGDTYLAVIFLCVQIFATGILFVMRKKEMY